MNQLPNISLGVYVRLYLLAARFNRAGALIDFTGSLEAKDIAFILRCDQKELEESMDLLENCSLLEHNDKTWSIPSFTDEQINLDEQRDKWRKTKADQRRSRNNDDAEINPEEVVIPETKTEEYPYQPLEQEVETIPEPEIIKDAEQEKIEILDKEITPENKRIEGEGEKENPFGFLMDKKADSLTHDPVSIVETLFPSVRNALFREIYREVNKDYKTDDILAGIKAMVEVTVLHNHWSKELWNHYNKEMAIELCDPNRREIRLLEEMALYEKKLTFDEKLERWANTP